MTTPSDKIRKTIEEMLVEFETDLAIRHGWEQEAIQEFPLVQKANEALALLTDHVLIPKVEYGWRTMESAPKDQSDILIIGIAPNGLWTSKAIVYFEPYEERGWLCSRTHKPPLIEPTRWTHLPQTPHTGDDDDRNI